MGQCLLSLWNGVGTTFGYRIYAQEQDRTSPDSNQQEINI